MNDHKPFPPLKKSVLAMLGPSVVFVALSLNGGEMLLWPSLVANYGLGLLWPILIILILQFVVNIEIERYTLVTGKRVEEALVQNKIWIAAVFALTVIAALMWPAWMSTAGNIIAVLFGVPTNQERNVGLLIAITLLAISVLVFRKPNIYKILERTARVGLSVALSIILLVVIIKFNTDIFLEGIRGLFTFGYLPASLPRFDFVAALAYGGVAGVLNLVQSEWIADKGYGVNSFPVIPEAASLRGLSGTHPNPRLDSNSEAGMTNQTEIESQESISNFKKWFAFINKEHALLFAVANVVSIFLLSYLGRILLPIGTAQGFGVLKAEILALNSFLPYLGTLFGIAGTLIFIMANLTILDAIGRLLHRILKPLQIPSRPTVQKVIRQITDSSGKLSIAAALLGIAVLALSLFMPTFKQPFFLLVLSACLSAFTMWLYPPLLLQLNYRLPKAARPSAWRAVLVVACALGYGFVTLWAASPYIPTEVLISIAAVVSIYQIWQLLKISYSSETTNREY